MKDGFWQKTVTVYRKLRASTEINRKPGFPGDYHFPWEAFAAPQQSDSLLLDKYIEFKRGEHERNRSETFFP
ncbi:hypothetical protein [Dechloromonas denitrificans]|uniref:hypothetical protein n=1 Tax=Dechloromonas denitrificans TaxID=281362 RepID=UPI001CF9801D|nr:hypothetical protein [Dechloromonas denitrificans]UCV06493.1 hypothetical protein KI615_13835 [Dechloromonas denitrificans]